MPSHRLAPLLLAALVVLVPAFSACLSGPADGTDGDVINSPQASLTEACNTDGDAQPSGNAPLLAAFRGDPADVAARFAQAVGDPLSSTEPDAARSDETATKWDTESGGSVSYRRSGGNLFALDWWSGDDVEPLGGVAEGGAFLNETLEEFGVPPGLMTPPYNTNPGGGPQMVFWQAFRGDLVKGTGGSLITGVPALTLHPAHNLSNASAAVSENETAETARAFLRCQLDREGKTEAAGYTLKDVGRIPWSVTGESLTRTVFLTYTEPGEPGHCSLTYAVDVDAETGAVLGWGRPPCD